MSTSTFNALTCYNFAEAGAANAGLGIVPPEITFNRNPTSTDLSGPSGSYAIGQLWFSSLTSTLFVLTSTLGGMASWASIASSSSGISTITGNSGGPIPPAVGGNINIVGSGDISVTGSGNTLTISSSGGSGALTWNNNATSGTSASNNGYIITAGSQSFSLPATSAVGDQIAFMLNGGTSWTITQGVGQQIRVNNQISALGAGGSVATTADGQTILLICTGANTTWQALSFVGSLNVVV